MANTKALVASGINRMGFFEFGKSGNKHGTVKQQVHDGDTTGLSTPLNFSSRFLGVDAPEVSFTIRTEKTFVSIGHANWVKFWSSGEWKKMPLPAALRNHLAARIGDGKAIAANHKKHADAAHRELEKLIETDMTASGKTEAQFKFFLAFAYEFLDGFARMLCYLNADRDNFKPPAKANRLSYNERLLATGHAVPYFIYPNTQPFLDTKPFEADNLKPKGFWKAVKQATRLRDARKSVATARNAKLGVFAKTDPLILLPYELRYIARKGSKGPDRFVIDLGDEGGNTLLKPEKYFKIKNLEDRLFIPREFAPLFQLNSWKVA